MAYSMDYASGISQHDKAKIEHSDRFSDKDEVKYRHEKDFNFITPLKSFVTLSVRDKSILKHPDYKVDRKFTPKRYQEPHFSRRPSYELYDDRDRLNKNQGSDYPPNKRYVDKDTFSEDYQSLNREREAAYVCEFEARRHSKDETVSEYGQALRRLGYLAFPNEKQDSEMMEKVLINKFIRGLNNLDLQKHVQFQRANTLDTAISYAIEYEAFINPQNNMRKPMLTSNEVPIQAIKDNKKESTELLTLDQVAKLIDEKLSQLKHVNTETENRNGYYQNRPPRFNNRGRGSLDSILTTANGNALSVKGKCILNIAIGPLLVKQEVIVADIKGSSGILGMNFFEQNEIDIQIKSQCLSINGQSIPLFKENSSQCSRIQIARQVSIPANSEMIIEASKRDSFVDGIGIIEPLEWVKSKGLLVAKSLVDTENTIYLAIMNLNSKSVKLKQGEQIAHLMTIEQVFDEDNVESQTDSKSNDISEQVNTLKDVDMPEHLKSMLDKVSSDLKDEEKQKLSSLIHEYKDIFVGPDGSLGRTDRVKHYIDTGDAKPVKISPRRVALKQRDVLEEELKKMIDKNLIEPSYIEYFENVKTTDCIDDLNTVKDGHASCLSVQSVINDTETDGDTDSVRGCLATHLAIRPVNVNTEELSFDITSNWLSYWSNSQLREMQENDQNISFILNNLLQSDEKPKKSEIQNKSKETKILYGLWESLTIQNNLLCKFFERENQGLVYQFVAPEQIRNFIFQQLHCTKYSAHFGRDKTLDLIKKRFYWPNMSDSIKLWINSCDLCAKGKPGPGKGKSPLKSSVSTYPLDRIAIDIIGPLPITTGGNEYIMVVEDYFTKWTESYAIPNHQALTVADKLVTEFICRFGCPFQIHTDQGREFESGLFAAICDKLGIDKTRTCPYRPQSDGMVERFNQTLQSILRLFVNEHRNDWDDHIPFINMAYRATQHASTKCSPNLLMFGHELRCPIDVMFGLPQGYKSIPCPIAYVEWVQEALRNAFQLAHTQSGLSANRQKENYDKNFENKKF
ncbi:Hypothetical predicted protein [Mytilus galloprovincialis]|uniref:Integrase catalytic domain-containing protein n=1 Tax=Mytilus galloprovincialis TaxID=29158 RepID=A0A8B6HAU8_MYTGA|nr:Hypothetical predicted protein [Mytilus galloprovincialis]